MSKNIIHWQNNNTPRSSLYDDIYFSTENGIEESRAVFLDGIDAPDVWQGRDQFTICELGFGTGLNFLNTVRLWMDNSVKNQCLNYLAVELHPLSKVEINKAVHWGELEDHKTAFLGHYPKASFNLYDGRVSFQLLRGDCVQCLRQTTAKIDAWYMDGFAPAKNPDMWSEQIFDQMTRLSNDRARVATFTSAGFVRRGLLAAKFQMSKRAGYGKKREMLSGIMVNK